MPSINPHQSELQLGNEAFRSLNLLPSDFGFDEKDFLRIRSDFNLPEFLEKTFGQDELPVPSLVYRRNGIQISIDEKRWAVGYIQSRENQPYAFTVIAYPRSQSESADIQASSNNLTPYGPSEKFPGAVGVITAHFRSTTSEKTIEVESIQACLSFSNERSIASKPIEPNIRESLLKIIRRHNDWRENAFDTLLDFAREVACPIAVCIDRKVNKLLAQQWIDPHSNTYSQVGSNLIERAVDAGYVSVRYQDTSIKFYPRFVALDIPSLAELHMQTDTHYHPRISGRVRLSIQTDEADTYYDEIRQRAATQDFERVFSLNNLPELNLSSDETICPTSKKTIGSNSDLLEAIKKINFKF